MPVRRRRKDPDSQLRYAIEDGNLEEVKGHLAAGVDPGRFDSDGETALHMCARYGSAEMARMLLDSGVKADACGTSYVPTPLCFAAVRNDIAIAQVLLDAGADININCANLTPLASATKSGNVEMLLFLLERGASIRDDLGRSMLEFINQYTKNREEVERLLREYGAE